MRAKACAIVFANQTYERRSAATIEVHEKSLTKHGRASIMFSMNKLGTETRVRIIAALVEGVGVNATCRMTGAAKNTVLKLLRELGEACQRHHDKAVRNVKAKRIQCDEIW